jgi:PleD family two-component response regulator
MTEKERVPGKPEDATWPTILVVATDASVLKMLQMALKVEYVCEVLPFSNGRSALEAVKSVRPDLILIHSLLLGLNALELAAQLHSIEGRASVPVLLAHAPVASYRDDQEPYLIVLGQPFVLEDLYRAINTCLGRIL